MNGKKSRYTFSRFARAIAQAAGSPIAFVLACLSLVIWAATGPLFHYNDTWQLVINTITTVITFLMVFLIQSSQNFDTEALQIKLDELIRATQGASNELLNLEKLDAEELHALRARYEAIAKQAVNELGRREREGT